MSRIRCRNTAPELALRKALWRQGLRYRLKSRLPGKPDLVFPSAKVAVFVDGCFWHSCPVHGHTPKSNDYYWGPKLQRNIARDREVDESLAALGWQSLRLWEHEVEEDIEKCVTKIAAQVYARRQYQKTREIL